MARSNILASIFCLSALLSATFAQAGPTLPLLYTQIQKITRSSPAEVCGASATLSGNGNVALYGCPETSNDRGILYLYRVNNQGTSFSQSTSFQPAVDGNKAKIGYSAAINADGTVLAFGGPNALTSGSETGAFWYSRFVSNAWTAPTEVRVTGSSHLGKLVALSPDASWLVAADSDYIHFYKRNSITFAYEVSASNKRTVDYLTWMEFDGSGSTLVFNGRPNGSGSASTVVLRLGSGDVWSTAQTIPSTFSNSAGISQNGNYVAVSYLNSVFLYKLGGNNQFAYQQILALEEVAVRVVFTSTSTRLLVATPYDDLKGGFLAYDLNSTLLVNPWKPSSSLIRGSTSSWPQQATAIAASSNGQRVISGGPNELFRGAVWLFKDATTFGPTKSPTKTPTNAPTSQAPTFAPTKTPTNAPTSQTPTAPPTEAPTDAPTSQAPTSPPTEAPTDAPTSQAPTSPPTDAPTDAPTSQAPTSPPTDAPTDAPTSKSPTSSPTTKVPTSHSPTNSPTSKTPTSQAPTSSPSPASTQAPSKAPTLAPSTASPNTSPTFPPSAVQFCKPQNGLTKAKCQTRMTACARLGIPMKWGGAGCKVNNKPLGDGGCQCQSYCGYKCQGACNADTRCRWTSGACYNKASGQKGESMPICVSQ